MVIIPRAAAINACFVGPSCSAAAVMPAEIFSIGMNSPMMPVDSTSA